MISQTTAEILLSVGLVVAVGLLAISAFLLRERLRRRRAHIQTIDQRADALMDEIALVEFRFRRDAPLLMDELLRSFVERAGQESKLVLERAAAAIAGARKIARRSPKAADVILTEVAGSIAAAEEMFRSVDSAVREIRSLASGLLERVAAWREELFASVLGYVTRGFPLAEEGLDLSLLRFPLAADRLLIDSDPFGVLADLTIRIQELARLGHAVALYVAVRERVLEISAAVPVRLEEIARALPVALEAVLELRSIRPDPRWEDVSAMFSEYPKMMATVRERAARAEKTCLDPECRVSEALRDAVSAERIADDLEDGLQSVLKTWAEIRGGQSPS